MTTWLISYKHRRGGELRLEEVHSIPELLEWIKKNASLCVAVTIVRMEE